MKFVIWSNEHKAWWRPNSQGYTLQMHQAGFYTLEQAVQICLDANLGQKFGDLPNEMMFPVAPRPAPKTTSSYESHLPVGSLTNDGALVTTQHPAGRKTPAQWCYQFGVAILDPDGWDRKSENWYLEWNRPITQDQFLEKFHVSTTRIVDKEKHLQYKHLFDRV
jgi:hypothetical protein